MYTDVIGVCVCTTYYLLHVVTYILYDMCVHAQSQTTEITSI